MLISENFMEARAALSCPGVTSLPSNQTPVKVDIAAVTSVTGPAPTSIPSGCLYCLVYFLIIECDWILPWLVKLFCSSYFCDYRVTSLPSNQTPVKMDIALVTSVNGPAPTSFPSGCLYCLVCFLIIKCDWILAWLVKLFCLVFFSSEAPHKREKDITFK